jgi:hypothetical protein
LPGSPATSTRYGAPRYANADAVDFAGQVNGVTDTFDSASARFVQGTIALRPAATSTPHRTFYFATDRVGQVDELSVCMGASDGTRAWANVPIGQLGTAEIADNAVTLAKMATDSVARDELAINLVESTNGLQRVAMGDLTVPGDSSAVAAHGLGTTPNFGMVCFKGLGLPGAGNEANLSYDFPNATQIRIFNQNVGSSVCTWQCWTTAA